MISHMYPWLNLNVLHSDPAQHLRTADAGSAVDDLHDLYELYELDRDLSEV